MSRSVPLLSICIPTYQRYVWVRRLLAQIDEEMKGSALHQVEVCVIDNASTDETYSFLQSLAQEKTWLRVQQNPLNVGLEGNVIRAMLAGEGLYTWLLSDHQELRRGVVGEVLPLLATSEPDIVCMTVAPWRDPLAVSGVTRRMGELSRKERSALIFTLGNLSVDLYRTELMRKTIRLSHQISYFVYPHLAILSSCNNATKVAQISEASALPNLTKGAPPMLKSYDPFVASFIHNLNCVRHVLADSEIEWSGRDFQTKDYIRSLGAWSIRILAAPQARRGRTSMVFLRAFWSNRIATGVGVSALVCLGCALFVWMPLGFRRWLMRQALRKFAPHANVLQNVLAA